MKPRQEKSYANYFVSMCDNILPCSYLDDNEFAIFVRRRQRSATYQLKRFSSVALFLAPCKVVQESLGFRIPSCGFGIPCLWILDSMSVDSGFHKQQPGFWITIMVGFRIPQTKITWITLHGAIFSSGVRDYW